MDEHFSPHPPSFFLVRDDVLLGARQSTRLNLHHGKQAFGTSLQTNHAVLTWNILVPFIFPLAFRTLASTKQKRALVLYSLLLVISGIVPG